MAEETRQGMSEQPDSYEGPAVERVDVDDTPAVTAAGGTTDFG